MNELHLNQNPLQQEDKDQWPQQPSKTSAPCHERSMKVIHPSRMGFLFICPNSTICPVQLYQKCEMGENKMYSGGGAICWMLLLIHFYTNSWTNGKKKSKLFFTKRITGCYFFPHKRCTNSTICTFHIDFCGSSNNPHRPCWYCDDRFLTGWQIKVLRMHMSSSWLNTQYKHTSEPWAQAVVCILYTGTWCM